MTVRDVMAPQAPALRRARSPYLLVLGLGLLLLTWILLMPPFGGSDEYDHAYRAAAAARGEWFVAPTAATRGGGAWLEVPRDIVSAARAECQARDYTTAADCVGTTHGDTVRIASGAGRYHPLFYAVIGAVALPFHGTEALYAMRLATAALALGLVALALSGLATWARSRTAYLAPVVACTPVMVYSCSIVSPNGVEIAAALAFWTSTIGLFVAGEQELRRLSLVAAIAGSTLCTLRPMGPLWCLLTGIVVLVAVRPNLGRVRVLVGRRDVRVTVAVVVVSALQSAAWTIGEEALGFGKLPDPVRTSVAHRLGEVSVLIPVWVLQSIAAFPMRDDGTSPAVYLSYLLLFGVLVVTALRCADRRVCAGMAAIPTFCLVFPFVTTMSSYDTLGAVWQGRYGLPFAIGMVVLAAYALDRSGGVLPRPWPVLAGLLFVAAQVVSAAYTLHVEVSRSPLAHAGTWPRPPMVLLVLTAVAGAALLWWGDPRPTTSGGARA